MEFFYGSNGTIYEPFLAGFKEVGFNNFIHFFSNYKFVKNSF